MVRWSVRDSFMVLYCTVNTWVPILKYFDQRRVKWVTFLIRGTGRPYDKNMSSATLVA